MKREFSTSFCIVLFNVIGIILFLLGILLIIDTSILSLFSGIILIINAIAFIYTSWKNKGAAL